MISQEIFNDDNNSIFENAFINAFGNYNDNLDEKSEDLEPNIIYNLRPFEKENEKIRDIPEPYELASIIKILKEYNEKEHINLLNLLNEENRIQSSYQYKFICSRKKEGVKLEPDTYSTTIENEINFTNQKRGRKKMSDSSTIHNKMSPDNILKKIKSKIFNGYILDFLNSLLNLKYLHYSKKLVKLNYKKYINNLKRQQDIEYLDMTLKQLLSFDITTKSAQKDDREKKSSILKPEHNREILDKIEKNPTIDFVLNWTYKDFIDLFTHKKSLRDLVENEDHIDCERIKKYLPGVENFFDDLLKTNDTEYSLLVVFYLFNYERSILMKQIRKK